MTPLSQLWVDELKKLHPEPFEDDLYEWRTLDVMDEYWFVYFNPNTTDTTIYAQCGDEFYNNPTFIEKATVIAKEYYSKHFANMMLIVSDLIEEAKQKNITPTLVIVPQWIVEASLPRYGIREDFKQIPRLNSIFGIPLRIADRSNVIRVENAEQGFLREKKYE